jgi:hypothetical protein
MHDIALYYPHIDFRDDAWLKAAALYWPRIARLAPAEYPRNDSETVRQLSGELDFILDIEPTPYSVGVAYEFEKFIWRNWAALQGRYSIPESLKREGSYPTVEPAAPDAFGECLPLPQARYWQPGQDLDYPYLDDRPPSRIHIEKLTFSLKNGLLELGLAARSGNFWIVTHPALAAVYLSALAEHVARANDLAVVTDHEGAYGTINGWDTETLASVLLRDDQAEERALNVDEVGALYAAVAVRVTVPARIDDIPVDKIIKARRKLAPEFDAFRDHLSLLADRLTELGQIKDPSVLQARLELMVERDLRRPTQELEGKLRQLGLEPAQAVLGLKSLELPAAAAAAASAVALPAGVTQAGLVAARLLTSGVQSRTQRQQILRSSPAGYLLGLEKQLTPGSAIERLRQRFRRAGKHTGPYRS